MHLIICMRGYYKPLIQFWCISGPSTSFIPSKYYNKVHLLEKKTEKEEMTQDFSRGLSIAMSVKQQLFVSRQHQQSSDWFGRVICWALDGMETSFHQCVFKIAPANLVRWTSNLWSRAGTVWPRAAIDLPIAN